MKPKDDSTYHIIDNNPVSIYDVVEQAPEIPHYIPTYLKEKLIRARYLPILQRLVKEHSEKGITTIEIVPWVEINGKLSCSTVKSRLADAANAIVKRRPEMEWITHDDIDVDLLARVWSQYKITFAHDTLIISHRNPQAVANFNKGKIPTLHLTLRTTQDKFEQSLSAAHTLYINNVVVGTITVVGPTDEALKSKFNSWGFHVDNNNNHAKMFL